MMFGSDVIGDDGGLGLMLMMGGSDVEEVFD